MAQSTKFQLQPRSIQQEHKDLIRRLVDFQTQFEYPSLEDVLKVTPFALADSEEARMQREKHMAEMMILHAQVIVKFSQNVPGFQTLSLEDQKTLLKANFYDVMMLRAARKYDKDSKSILLAVTRSYTLNSFRSASMEIFGKDLFYFCQVMSIILPTRDEYALLTAAAIFSETSGLHEPDKVKEIRIFYKTILSSYVAQYRPADQQSFSCQLFKLMDSVNFNKNKEKYLSCEVDRRNLPPLLNMIWKLTDPKRC